MVDLFYATSAIAKVCLELLRHRRFKRCKVHAVCFAGSTKALGETYARHILNKKSDILCNDEVGGYVYDSGSRAG